MDYKGDGKEIPAGATAKTFRKFRTIKENLDDIEGV